MGEFTVNNREYRTRRMNAFAQLHVARRILPVAAKLPDMLGLTLEDCLTNSDRLKAAVAKNLGAVRLDAVAETLSGLDDEDVEYVLNACADAVEMRQATGWAPVRVNGRLMFDFVGPRESVMFAVQAVKDNLADFFSGNVPASPNGTSAKTA